jgi:hypothetical protein
MMLSRTAGLQGYIRCKKCRMHHHYRTKCMPAAAGQAGAPGSASNPADSTAPGPSARETHPAEGVKAGGDAQGKNPSSPPLQRRGRGRPPKSAKGRAKQMMRLKAGRFKSFSKSTSVMSHKHKSKVRVRAHTRSRVCVTVCYYESIPFVPHATPTSGDVMRDDLNALYEVGHQIHAHARV